jgi:hypothetical protein
MIIFILFLISLFYWPVCSKYRNEDIDRVANYLHLLGDKILSNPGNAALRAEYAAAMHEWSYIKPSGGGNSSFEALQQMNLALALGLEGNLKIQALYRKSLLLIDLIDNESINILEN